MEDLSYKAQAAQVPIPLPETSILFHPAVLILLTVLSSQLLKLVGNEGILAVISPIHLRVFHGSTLSRQRQLKKDLFETRQALNQTSSQDQFAKWAKLRRKVDKTLADLEAINNVLASSKNSLGLLVKVIMFTLATLVPFAVTTWFRKTPIFWLPPGPSQTSHQSSWSVKGAVGPAGAWLGPVGWMLSLPSAPRGSVSATVWSQVCGRVLALVFSLAADLAITFNALGSSSATDAGPRPGQTLAQPNTSLQSIWYSIGLATCSFGFSQFEYLEEMTGVRVTEDFGGHYQFLTNCGLALTFVTLLLALTSVLAPTAPYVGKLKTTAAIITLPVETMISLLYWTVLAIDPTLLVPQRKVSDPYNPGQFVMETVRLPLHVDLCLHAMPAILLLVDFLIFSPPFPVRVSRSFTLPFPHLLSLFSTLAYCIWAEVCNYHNGHYPYPLLSVLTTTQRAGLYITCALVIVTIVEGSQQVHRTLDRALNRTWVVPNPSPAVADKKQDKKLQQPATVPADASSSKTSVLGADSASNVKSRARGGTGGDKDEL